MVKEKPQEALDFCFPYYAYAEKTLTVPPHSSEAYLTLKFSSSIYWHNLMITALIQTSSCYANIQPIDDSTARITVVNYVSDSSESGIVRVMALLPINATISLT